MPKFKDLTGEKYGYLTVLRRLNYSETGHTYLWECKCDCGNITIVRGGNLRTGHTISCGCKKGLIKHSKANTRLYCIYKNMKQRCNNPNNVWYKNYGARGIKICDEWLNDFNTFYNWAISNGYEDSLSLDRIDVNGDYEPFNCRWATKLIQQNNMRRNKLITYKNKTHTVAEWEHILKLPYNYIRSRLRSNTFENIMEKLAAG